MHPADIKAAIEKAGSSQRDIAHECDVSPSTVRHVIKSTGTSTKVATAIANLVGLPMEKLWPGKYSHVQPAEDADLGQQRRRAQAAGTAARRAA